MKRLLYAQRKVSHNDTSIQHAIQQDTEDLKLHRRVTILDMRSNGGDHDTHSRRN